MKSVLRGCHFSRLFLLSLFILTNFSYSFFQNEALDMENLEVVSESSTPKRSASIEKPWTIIIYIAGSNDLGPFVWPNMRQLARIGSNLICNIVVQINEPSKSKPTQRYYIEKNKAVLLNKEDADAGIKLDSGNDQTLVDFVGFCMDEYPSEKVCLILWNHGSGIIDPGISKTTNSAEFFNLNPQNLMLELNRKIEFLDAIMMKDTRGICFDETYRSYLTNNKLARALGAITRKRGKKIDLLGLDACLMAMVEFGLLVKPFCKNMVASQEVELGWGWDYARALSRFSKENLTPELFAQEIVDSYQAAYNNITPDYTLSACNLEYLDALNENISRLAEVFIECIKNCDDGSVQRTIERSREKRSCTHFEEPSYIDAGHFYQNVKNSLHKMNLNEGHGHLINELQMTLHEGLEIIDQAVFAKVNGKNLKRATGLSIYFPPQTKYIHRSYQTSSFAKTNKWVDFLKVYMH